MLAALLYAAGTFAVHMYTADECYDNSEPVLPAQTW